MSAAYPFRLNLVSVKWGEAQIHLANRARNGIAGRGHLPLAAAAQAEW